MKRAARKKTRKQSAATGFDSSELDQIVGHLTRVVQVRLFQLYYERLRRLRVSPGAFALLVAIRRNPGVQHTTLAAALAAHGPNITQLVHKLVRDGLVERRKLPNDGRAIGHFLTARGQAKAARILEAGLAHDRRATSALSTRERGTLLALLAKLDRALASAARPA